MSLSFILVPTLVILALLGLNHLIRFSLTAPRVVADTLPDGLPWQDARIPTLRGKTLSGWFIPAANKAPAVAILHGWGSNAGMMLPLAGPLHDAGYAILLFDARSHGGSDDDSFASLPRFAEDLEHAFRWLQARPEVDPQRVGLIGHSVGAGAALLTASRCPEVAVVVSLAAFAHPATMMRRWLQSKRIPRLLSAYILFYVQRVIGHRFDDIAPCNTIRKVRCPVLLAHGSEDATVPVSDARAIYANRSSDDARLLLIPGGHDEYQELESSIGSVIGFLDGVVGPLAQGRDLSRR